MEQPIVLDMGKQKRKRVRELKTGEGKLMAQVMEAMEQVKDGLGKEAEGKELLPVIVIYQKKQKRSSGLFPFKM